MEGQELTVREILNFIHDTIRLIKFDPLDGHAWTSDDPSDFIIATRSFLGQPLIRLVDNVVKRSQVSRGNLSELRDVILIIQESLNANLELLANQGLFDPLLPWIGTLPFEHGNKSVQEPTELRDDQVSVIIDQEQSDESLHKDRASSSAEVVIHVVDDVRGSHKDFYCLAKLLLEKMPYFVKATQGQILSDVDITVHCDVNIFDWLTKWMKNSNRTPLEPTNVVPILLSAVFLESDILVEECLDFCHSHMNQILDSKQSFSCLSNQLIQRLATEFTVAEVERLGHHRSSVQSRLYVCLIAELCSAKAQPKRGIFETASTLYQCSHCCKFLNEHVDYKVPCTPGRIILTITGDILYSHQRNLNWSLIEHIDNLKMTLKTWRKVFWRLWGQVHFLNCSSCNLPFALTDFHQCQFHPEQCFYPSIVASRGYCNPIGKFTCCQKTSFRFSLIPDHGEGCKMKKHCISPMNSEAYEQIQSILDIYRQFEDLIRIPPTKPATQSDDLKLIQPVNMEELIARFTLGSLNKFQKHLVPLPWQRRYETDKNRPKTACSSQDGSQSNTESGDYEERCTKMLPLLGRRQPFVSVSLSCDDAEIVDDEDINEDEVPTTLCKQSPLVCDRDVFKRGNGHNPFLNSRGKFSYRRESKIKPQSRLKEVDLRWSPVISTRCNQENQHCFEDDLFHRIIMKLKPDNWQKARPPAGGVFAKINRQLQEQAQRQARLNKQVNATKKSNEFK